MSSVDFPNEELVELLCKSATTTLRGSFPDHERIWAACKYPPRVEFSFEESNDRLVVKYAMIFRRAGGKIYRTVTSNRLYRNALVAIPEDGLAKIFDGWTKDFLEKVSRAKSMRDVTSTEQF